MKRVIFPPLNTSRPTKYSCFFHKRSRILKITKNNREKGERQTETQTQRGGERERNIERETETARGKGG